MEDRAVHRERRIPHNDGQTFSTDDALDVPALAREAAHDLVWEIAEWRLSVYLRRPSGRFPDRIICKVSHSSGRPSLFLPHPQPEGIPEGWQEILVEGEANQATFAKIAINVVTLPGSEENVLPAILRRWFGDSAGSPGRTDQVVFQRRVDGLVMMPARDLPQEGPVLWQRYARAEVPKLFATEFKGMENQVGVVQRHGLLLLFVTLDKRDKPEEHRYRDRFLSPTEFEWQSQNRTTQASELGRDLRLHRELGIDVHLFVRRRAKRAGGTERFIYCGKLEFQRWEGERPITVWWKLDEAVPEDLRDELSIRPESETREVP